jgi:hypothetical protein
LPYYQRRKHCRSKIWNIWLTYSLKAIETMSTAFCVLKNRFGSTAEIGIYEMLGSGLREVSILRRYFA